MTPVDALAQTGRSAADGDSAMEAPAAPPAGVVENADALPGLLSLALPRGSQALLALTGSAGVGHYPPVREAPGSSQQLSGGLALAISPLPFLSARLRVRGDLNLHSGGDTSLYGEPELALRLHHALTRQFRWGAELEARLVGAEAPSVDWGATTPTLRALASYGPSERWLVSAQLGYRLDRSSEALPPLTSLRDSDRATLPASSFDAVEIGLGAAYRWGHWEFAGELGSELLLGADSPGVSASPFWLGLGARRDLTRALNVFAQAEVAPHAEPDPYPGDVIVANRARFSGLVGLTLRWGLPGKTAGESPPELDAPKEDEAVEAAPQPAVDSPPTTILAGRVVDEGGRPLTDVEVRVELEGADPVRLYSDAEGKFAFDALPLGSGTLVATTPGYEERRRSVELTQEATSNLEVTLYEAVPAGQVRGRVLDYQGQPVGAQVAISPGQKEVGVETDGSFTVDLTPGRYTVRFSAEGYRAQVRSVLVRDKGVVVLHIALEK